MKAVTLQRQVLATIVAVMLATALLLSAGCTSGQSASTGVTTIGSAGQSAGGSTGSAPDAALSSADAAKSAAEPNAATPAQTDSSARSSEAAATGAARMVVRTVSMRLKVDDVDKTARRVATLANASQGYVESMQVSTDSGGPVYAPMTQATDGSQSQGSTALGGYVTVRIPARSLEKFRADVAGLGKVVYESTDSQDVTAQHADLKARLKNLEATETGLRRLFDKAKTVNEMLAIQNQLTQVQGEIESLTAQIKVVEDQAAMSTVTVQLVGPESVVTPAGDDWGFTTAVRTAVRAFVGTINVLIVALGATLPLIVIVALVVILIVWLVRRSGRKRLAKASSEAAPAPGTTGGDAPNEPADDAEDPRGTDRA